jgi:hypothetical protein
MTTLTTLYGIDHRLITPYHPSANGLVERMNKEVSRALKKYTEGTYAAWDEWMPLVQLGLNESINQRTGSTAFALMYGRRFNNFKDFSQVDAISNVDKATTDVQTVWKQFRDVVLPGLEKRVVKVKQQQEQRLNSRKQSQVLKPGTKVMAVDQTKGSKWDLVYEGPFEIVKQHDGGSYSLRNSLGEILDRRQTIDMLKVVDNTKNKVISDIDQHYEVETIKKHRKTPSGYEFLVKWKNYSKRYNFWVKAEDFNTQQVIKKY